MGHYASELGIESPYYSDWPRINKLKRAIEEVPLSAFRAKDLGPLLRLMNDFQGEVMRNDITKSDVDQLELQLFMWLNRDLNA